MLGPVKVVVVVDGFPPPPPEPPHPIKTKEAKRTEEERKFIRKRSKELIKQFRDKMLRSNRLD